MKFTSGHTYIRTHSTVFSIGDVRHPVCPGAVPPGISFLQFLAPEPMAPQDFSFVLQWLVLRPLLLVSQSDLKITSALTQSQSGERACSEVLAQEYRVNSRGKET